MKFSQECYHFVKYLTNFKSLKTEGRLLIFQFNLFLKQLKCSCSSASQQSLHCSKAFQINKTQPIPIQSKHNPILVLQSRVWLSAHFVIFTSYFSPILKENQRQKIVITSPHVCQFYFTARKGSHFKLKNIL